MPKISISYRRADSAAIAGRIYDRLSAQYGEQAVFLDIDSIAVGADFRHQLQENLRASDLLLVIIGPGWLGKTPGGKTRINESHDPIRLEIETALTLGLVIVPVLVGGAVMPRPDEVPFSLQDLTFRNAAEVDSGRDFSLHMEHLIRSIDRIVDRKRQLTPPPVHERPQPLQTRVEQRTGTPNPALLANLKTIASEFFGAPAKSVSVAGRNHAQLVKLDGNRGWLCGIADPNPEDVAEFAQFLNPPERGFFIYDGGLSPSTSMALDRLRVEGKSIIPIGLNAMSAAIADGNTSVLLADLQRAYESNLFDTRNAIIDERFFFGRSELLNKVGSALARGEHVLVSGLRKCGKTSFLNILRRHLLSHPVCIVDLQRYDRHTEDWPSALFGLIIKSYDQWGFRTFRDWPGKTNKSSAPTTATQLEDSLSIRRAWQRDRGRQEPLILILDEAERIFPADDEIEPARKYTRAAGALRMVGQSSSDRPLAIIAADLRPWLNRKNILADGSTNPFFHFFLEVPLPLLSQFAVGELVRVIGSASGITRVESAYVDELYTLSGGHPSITRMIAGASHKARQKSNELTLADLHAGLDEMAGSDVLGAFFRANLWGLMTNEEKASLRGVADGSIFKWLRAKVGFATRSPRQPPYPEAAANLSDQGILRDGKIAIGSFDEWLRGLPTSGA